MKVKIEQLKIDEPMWNFHWDLVFCIKDTISMKKYEEAVKYRLMRLIEDIPARMLEKGKKVVLLRVKLILFGR